MKVGTEDKKKLIAATVLGFFALGAAFYLYETLFSGPTTPPPAKAAVVTTAPTVRTVGVVSKNVSTPAGYAVAGAQKVGTTSGQLDPTLHMEPMLATESLIYTGTGRNIFSAGSAEVVAIPKPITAARPIVIPPVVAQGPPPPQGPPPAPPINLKFFGTATTPGGKRRAFLLNGDDVYLASVGDVVQRRYRVVSIAAGSILVEDMPNSNRQTLPLTGN